MAYVPTAAESYGADASVIQLDSSHPGYVSVPDAKFLFTAEFHRAGPDLLLTGQDGERHLIPGYFTAAERPALTAPNGASFSPDLIHLLAGSVAPGQYAQAQPSAPPDSIGKIEKVVGDVTVVRNGVSVALNVGDAVYKSDVIQTGANSSVGIGFPDGTALQLVANTRMALNDYSFDPNGTSNTALFSLVEGTFAFVAGKVAHTGDMKIATPVATMGIRGTTGYVQEAATISANSGNVSYSYVIVDDYASTNHGQYDLIDQSGNVLATVSQTEFITYVTPQGIGLPPLVSTMPMSNSQVAFGQSLIQQVFQTLNLINNPNPQTNGTNGSSTPEQLNSPLFPQLIHDQGTIPLDLNGSGGGSSSGTPLTVTLDIVNPPPIAATNIFIWTSPASGTFQTAPDWNTGAVPAASDTVEINNPLVTVTIDQVETVNNLMIVAGAVVNIVDDPNGNGFLTILSGLDNAGLIEVGSQGSDPKLEDIGATTVASGAQIEANGSDATVDYQNNQVVNAGIIDATNSGTVSFEFVTIDNEPGGTAGEGTIIAQLGGTVTFDHTIIDNTDSGLNDGSVVANGAGSTVFLYDGTTVVGGTLSTSDGGLIEIANGPDETSSNVTFDGSETSGDGVLPVTIASGSEVQVDGGTSLTLLGTIVNEGKINIDGVLGADLVIDGIVTLNGGGAVTLTGSADEIIGASSGGTLDNVANTISGVGEIVGTVDAPLIVDNQINGVIEANVANGTLTLNTDTNAIINAGLIEANGGALTIDATPVTNSGTLLATDASTLTLSDDTVTNTGGTVEVDAGSTLDLEGSSISSGTVDVYGTLNSTGTSAISGASLTDGGVVEATTGTLTIDPGSIDNTALLEANGGALTIDATPVANSGTLLATDASTLTLSDDTVTNTGGTVEVAAGSLLDFASSSVNGGAVEVYGTVDSTGTSSINGASIRNTGTLEASSGTLTIDPSSIDNSALVEANGGALIIDDTPVVNSGTLEATNGGTLTLSDDRVTDTPGYTPVGTPNPAVYTFIGTGADVVATFVGGGSAADTDILEMSVNGGPYVLSTLHNHGSSIGATYDFGFVPAGAVLTFAILNESTGSTLSSDAALNADHDQHVWAFGYTQGTLGLTNINSGIALNFEDLLGAGSDFNYADLQVVVTGATDPTPLPSSATVEVAAGSQLNLESSSIGGGPTDGSDFSGGVVEVYGTLDSTGTSSINDASISNTGTLEATSGTLTIDPGSIDNSGLLEANGGALTIDATPVISTGTLQATDASTLTLSGDTVTNTGGVVHVDAGSTLDLAGSGISGGTVDVYGTLDSTGASSINGANLTNTDLAEVTSDTLTLSGDTVTNTGGVMQVDASSLLDFSGSSIVGGTVDVYGTLNSTGTSSVNGAGLTNSDIVEATSGTLTIDPGSIDNSGLLEANGGALTIDATPVTNSGTLKATDTSTLTLSGDTVTNTGGLLQVDAGSTINFAGSGISGGTVEVSGTLDSTGTNSISGATLIDAGLVEVTNGSALTINDTPVINSGTLQATGASTLAIGGAVDNSLGTVVVDYGSKVDIGGDIFDGNAVVDGGTLTYGSYSNVGTSFDGIGMLVLDGTNSSNQFTGTVSDFGNGDIIDLAAISYSDETGLTYNAHLDTLTVSDGISGPSVTIQLAGSYNASNFVLSNDGNGDAELTFTAGEAHETPTLWLDATTATVNQGSTVVLPTIRVVPVDGDDTLTLTIAGLPTGATVTDSADSKVFSGSSFTLTGAEVGSTLTLNDGSNSGNFTLNVTANNTTIGEAASSATQALAVTVNPGVGPAGVAGSPINLALTNPSAANGAAVTVTITGVPSDWQLSQGTNLGNGTWTLQSDDLTTLTVLTAAAYAGAVELGVTETWTGANGATGLATIADNVETYAAGSPIFAWSGDDTLTGIGGHDEFVFAQSIGGDTIYNFNVATDKIDLLGFANVASFGDVEGHVTADSNGDAVITLGAGETITLHGVNVGSLTAADFVFNETPVVDNAGTLAVSDGATLPLDGTIDNTGTIALNGTGDQTELQIVGDGVTLQGGGQITMSDGAGDIIVGTTAATTLTNVDNTISGAGQIGAGDGNLTLVNDVHGTIEANIAGDILTVDTGNDITNNGILEATNGGVLQIDDAVSGSGHAVIAGGTVAFEAAANIDVLFDNGTSTPTYGELVLGDASAFAGQISGFSGTAPDAGHSDVIDLAGINYDSSSFSETYNASSGLLTVSDGSNIANLTLDNFDGTLSFASNGDGGTLITDPPATSSITADGVLSLPADGPAPTYIAAQNPADTLNQTVAVSIGGPGADSFVFAPGIGAETIANFDPQHDTIELNGFTDAHTVAELQSLITTDLHGDAVIDLGHNDSITLAGVTASHLQAVLQSAVHLH